jgi:hypothetical protein
VNSLIRNFAILAAMCFATLGGVQQGKNNNRAGFWLIGIGWIILAVASVYPAS